MKKQLVILLSVFLFIGFEIGMMATLSQTGFAQESQEQTVSEDLSNMNWDEPEEQSGEQIDTENLGSMDWDDSSDSGNESGELSGINWDEGADTMEEPEESAEEEEARYKAEADAEERQAMITHLLGFLLCVLYLVGLVGTAYFTRQRKIAVESPPELMILLHTFWPIEWLLVPLMAKSGKI